MEFSAQVTFPASAEVVARMITTEAYVLEKVAAAGSPPGQVEIIRSPDGTITITTRHHVAANQVPATYRSLVGRHLDVHQVDVWEAAGPGGSRRGTLAIEVAGAPVRVTGTLALAPSAGDESTLHLAGTIKASVPFIARTIEKAIADRVDHAVDIERGVGLRWLAEGEPRDA